MGNLQTYACLEHDYITCTGNNNLQLLVVLFWKPIRKGVAKIADTLSAKICREIISDNLNLDSWLRLLSAQSENILENIAPSLDCLQNRFYKDAEFC